MLHTDACREGRRRSATGYGPIGESAAMTDKSKTYTYQITPRSLSRVTPKG
jgi:hypothetical protein